MKVRGVERLVLRSRAWRVTRATLLPLILGLADLPKHAEVLELGTGGGLNAEGLLKRFPEWRLCATDYDPEMVELARRRLTAYAPRVRFDQADASQLRYGDGSFDLVVSILVWHHVGDWRGATGEVARVLRPGGRLVFADVFRNKRFDVVEERPPGSVRYNARHLFDVLTDSGLRLVSSRRLNSLACALHAQKMGRRRTYVRES